MCISARYLRGYIGGNESEKNWTREHTLTWEENISTIRKISGKYPQESYVEVVCAIQS